MSVYTFVKQSISSTIRNIAQLRFVCIFHQSHGSTSTVYWCIASKLKVPLIFVMEWKRFVGRFIIFQSVLLWWYYDKKSLPDIGGTTIHPRCRPPRCQRAVMEPGVHTMSDELILQISCNIFLDFKWISMMTSGQNISHYTTAKLSVHVWNHDLIWWQSKIDTQKHFRETAITSSWTLSKTKIPITIIKAQMLSNPNQKSHTRDNNMLFWVRSSLSRQSNSTRWWTYAILTLAFFFKI